MIHSDVARTIASYLDDSTLEKVFFSGAMPSLISASSDQNFWHQRVETLSGRRIQFSSANWRQTYKILEEWIHEEEPSFYNEEDNATVSRILSSLGHKPREEDLSEAAYNSCLNILQFLLEEGSINPRVISSHFYWPPLTLAATRGHEGVVRLLLSDSRVDPSSHEGSIDETTALAEASRALFGDNTGNYTRIVKLLLADPRVDPRWNDSAALGVASENGDNIEIMRLLLGDPRVDPSVDENQALISAAELGRDKIVILLLSDPRVDPSDWENRAIGRATSGGHTEVVRLLLADPRVDPEESDALDESIRYEHEDIFRLLLSDPRVNPSAANNHSLLEAIVVDNYEMAELLLQDERVIDSLDETDLWAADQRGNEKIMKLIRSALERKDLCR